MKSTCPAHTWGEAGATQSLHKAFFCSVQPSRVHARERERKRLQCNIPAHFAFISASLSQRDKFSRKDQDIIIALLSIHSPPRSDEIAIHVKTVLVTRHKN
jgi:hypothetical protein